MKDICLLWLHVQTIQYYRSCRILLYHSIFEFNICLTRLIKFIQGRCLWGTAGSCDQCYRLLTDYSPNIEFCGSSRPQKSQTFPDTGPSENHHLHISVTVCLTHTLLSLSRQTPDDISWHFILDMKTLSAVSSKVSSSSISVCVNHQNIMNYSGKYCIINEQQESS